MQPATRQRGKDLRPAHRHDAGRDRNLRTDALAGVGQAAFDRRRPQRHPDEAFDERRIRARELVQLRLRFPFLEGQLDLPAEVIRRCVKPSLVLAAAWPRSVNYRF